MKKYLFGVLAALTLCLCLLTVSASALTQLAAPSELEWGREYYWGATSPNDYRSVPGTVSFKANQPCQNKFFISLYRVGEEYPVSQYSGNYGSNRQLTYCVADIFLSGESSSDLPGNPNFPSGTYYFTIRAQGDGVTYSDSDTVTSSTWKYTAPSAMLPTITNLRWEGTTMCWDDISYHPQFDGHALDILFQPAGYPEMHSVSGHYGFYESQMALEDWDIQEEPGTYYFRVRGLSNDPTVTTGGYWSVLSPGYSSFIVVDSGYCGGEGDGTNLTWALTDDGTLTISGTGAMANYTEEQPAPWIAHKETVTRVVIGNGVTAVGEYAFYECAALTRVVLPESIMEIGKYAFYNCGALARVAIPSKVTAFGEYAFRGCSSLTEIVIPAGVTTISDRMFSNCTGLEKITLPAGLTTIGRSSFYNCTALTEITLPASVSMIDAYAFRGCSALTEIVIPAGVAAISDYTFYGCTGLTKLTIPDSVTSISEAAIYNCGLTELTIPSGVSTVGSYALALCSELETVTFEGAAPTIEGNAFHSVTATCYYPANTTTWTEAVKQNYGGTLTWVEYTPYIASGTCGGEGDGTNLTWTLTDDGTLTISGTGKMAKWKYSSSVPWRSHSPNIKTVVIADGVTTIGDNAFYSCSSLTSVTIPDSVTTIGDYAFIGCTGLTAVHITDIAAWCEIKFSGGAANPVSRAGALYLNGTLVTDMIIPEDVVTISDRAFRNCASLTSVTIGNGVTSIGDDAFSFCAGLTSVTIPDSVTTIGGGRSIIAPV